MNFIEELTQAFELLANPEQAIGAEAYMLHQFKFYGIYTKQRREISKAFIKQQGIISNDKLHQTIKQLYALPFRDFDYVAIELLAFHKKQFTLETIDIINFLLINNSWWDSVDHVASQIFPHYFKMFLQQIIHVTNAWNNSPNFWLIRSSIMFQKTFKQNTNTELLSKYILKHTTSKEFFVQKAIGWALREYASVNPVWVKEFVANNTLPKLSSREALRKL